MALSKFRTILSFFLVVILAGAAIVSIDKTVRADLYAAVASAHIPMMPRSIAAAECFDSTVQYCIVGQASDGDVTLPNRTDYWSSKLTFDAKGLPFLQGPNGAKYHNIATMAFAVWPRQLRTFEAQCRSFELSEQSRAILAQLQQNFVELEGGAVTWRYDYDTQINDVLLKAPWASAFSQSAVIERLLLAYCKTGEAEYLDLARRAGRAFAIPVGKGGVRSESDNFVWFQEVPLPDRHNPFVLNAHLYSIKVLYLLHQLVPSEGFDLLAERGIQAVRSVLPIVDNGYWNRYDLRPRYSAFNLRVSGQGVLQHVTLAIDGHLSEIDFPTKKRSPARNIYWRDIGRIPARVGVTLSAEPLNLQLVLPVGREFTESDALKPVTIKLTCAGGKASVKLATLGFRPGPVEYFAVAAASQTETVNGDQDLVYNLNFGEFSWGQVAPEYLPFQGSTLAEIGRRIGDKEFYLRGLRWEEFYRRFLATPPREGDDKERWSYDPDNRLLDAVWDRFRDRLPSDINDDEIERLITDTYSNPAMRDRARKTLGL